MKWGKLERDLDLGNEVGKVGKRSGLGEMKWGTLERDLDLGNEVGKVGKRSGFGK